MSSTSVSTRMETQANVPRVSSATGMSVGASVVSLANSSTINQHPSQPRSKHVGEVGRVLLSSTMLGYDAAVNAARKHVIPPNTSVTKTVYETSRAAEAALAVPPPIIPLQPPETVASQVIDRHQKRKKKKKHGKKDMDDAPVPLPIDQPPAVEALRRDILLETERLFQLAGDRESALRVQLEKLRASNQSLERDAWRSLTMTPSSVFSPSMPVTAGGGAPRWLTPRDSGYDSDSASTSTSATPADDGYVNASSASLYLRRRAQERILSQAQDAVSRAAKLCQILADPKEPGSIERRDVLLRAFKAITIDANEDV